MNERTTEEIAAFVRLHTDAAREVAQALHDQGMTSCDRISWGSLILGVQMLAHTEPGWRELVSVVTVTHMLARQALTRRKAN